MRLLVCIEAKNQRATSHFYVTTDIISPGSNTPPWWCRAESEMTVLRIVLNQLPQI